MRLFHGRHNGGGEGRREEPRSAGPGPPDYGRGVRTVRRVRDRMAGPDKPPAALFNPFGHAASFGRLVFRLYIGRPVVMIRNSRWTRFPGSPVNTVSTRFR